MGWDEGSTKHVAASNVDVEGLDTVLWDQLPESVAICTAQGVCHYVNPAMERVFGSLGTELVGGVLWELYPDVLRQELQERFQRVAATGEPEEFEWHFMARERWFVLRLFRGHGRVYVFALENTAEKKQEAILRGLYDETRRAQRHAAFLAQASEVLASSLEHDEILQRLTFLAVPPLADGCIVDVPMPDGRVRRVAMTHVRAELVERARAYHERYPIRMDATHGVGKVLRTGTTEFVPELRPDTSGQSRTEEVRRQAMLELGVTAYIIVPLMSRGRVLGALSLVNTEGGRRYTHADVRLAEDLARRAATSLDNGRLYTEAQEAVRARDSFLSVASHELNTPLTSLTLNVQALRRQLEATADKAPESVSHKVVAVQRQLSRLSSLVRELLDVSRITAGKLRLEREDMDLAALTRELLPRYAEELSRAGCALRLEAAETATGHWDKLRVEQVFQNLLSNAIKYGRGHPIDVRVGADSERAWLSVADGGMGIAQEAQPRLFQRFERLASERHYGGLGLGLWIVRQIVDAMDGRILVRSAPGQGSTFTVELPRLPPAR
ncbi:ATP-binding protein [Myxococcus landrumensis]|uniref:histidine kinase n=1 Tax=Myxococcus landrumensis TaxID=2813577 RepID=A0ABX7N5R7_9BACT|nr:ATP-binding protein [Myxococcus landrumus]QSQ13806.1 PAS domain-containing protein [Myxococcus landrumus]